MKRPSQTPCLVAATLFIALSASAADQPAAKAPPRESPAASTMQSTRAADLLKRFDQNKDGKLDDDERADAREAMMKEQLERQATRAAAPRPGQFRARMLEQFDKNRDGQLDDDERAEARKYAEDRGLGEGGEVREELMKRFDQNADGKLDATEQSALQKFLQERRAKGNGRSAGQPAMREQLQRRGKQPAPAPR